MTRMWHLVRLFINLRVEPSMSTLNIGTADERSAELLSSAPRPRSKRHPSSDRRTTSLTVAGALFVSIFLLRQLTMSKQDALSVLYVIPVAIVSLELGLRAGFVAAAGASIAVAVWLATRDLPFAVAPLAVRAAILFGVGLIAGWFSDQMRASSAVVASENERLGVLERDQAALQAEVERMRQRLGEQLRNAARVIERQEQERRGIARQLHEEAAQTMAAALVTVGLLERGAERELTRAQFDDVRSQVRSSIADLRRIASSLRPALLEEMGLESALSRISEIEAERNSRVVSFSTGELTEPLSPEAEASIYRVVEEVLGALDDEDSVRVSLATPEDVIQVVIDARTVECEETPEANRSPASGFEDVEQERLQIALLETRARVELVGGSLDVGSLLGNGTRVVAELPLES
jgi:two-component system, NarL family, sensor histidine kinase UhpB